MLGSLISLPLLEHSQELLIQVKRMFLVILNNHLENFIVLSLSINVPSASSSRSIVFVWILLVSRVCVKWLLNTVCELFVLVLVCETQ
jgi:hypothetical protein